MRALIPEAFERAGLGYERITSGHAAGLEPMMLDERVWRTLQDPGEPPPTPETVRRSAASKERHWQEHGFGQWVVREEGGAGGASGLLVARGGLQYTGVTGRPEVEIGWAVLPARWGQGIATEIARAAVEAAFGALALPGVLAYTQLDNIASRRVMEKAGLEPAGTVLHSGIPHLLYRGEPGR